MSGCISRHDGVATGGSSASNVVEQGLIVQTVVAATATGSTNILVLNFTGATTLIGAVALVDWVTRTDSAVNGTLFTILQPGVYGCSLSVPWNNLTSAGVAITLNATAGQMDGTTTPALRLPEVYAASWTNPHPLETGDATAFVTVTQSMIDASRNLIRAQVWQAGNTATVLPAGAYAIPGSVAFRMDRVGDAA